ncbi:hypothetical protein MMC29_006304 [Sticta canariensis]|nr:hypothetical protein [Sticta canariensis]
MDHEEATKYLSSMLGKQLRIHTTDTRMFVGDFKCTDNECNIILGRCFEYRPPMASALDTTSASVSGSSLTMDMTSRYLGLIVVPGQHISKIEIEIEIEENRKSN